MPIPLVAGFNNPYGPQVQFRTEGVLPPSAFYISPEDQILASFISSVTAIQVNLTLRLLLPTGVVIVYQYQLPPNVTVGVASTLTLPPTEGYLLSAMLTTSSLNIGSTFGQVTIQRGIPTGFINGGPILVQGYLTPSAPLTWPYQAPAGCFTGPGFLTEPGVFPLPGHDISATVPVTQRWRIRAITAMLTTSVAVGNRSVTLQLGDQAATLSCIIPPPGPQAPSTAVMYSWYPGAPFIATIAGFILAPLPDNFVCGNGGVVQTVTSGLAAGDFWNQINIGIEVWSGT